MTRPTSDSSIDRRQELLAGLSMQDHLLLLMLLSVVLIMVAITPVVLIFTLFIFVVGKGSCIFSGATHTVMMSMVVNLL